MPCALPIRSEEHTSELQSHSHLVCRLLLEKKNDAASSRVRCSRCTSRLAPRVRLRGALPWWRRSCFLFNDTAPTEIYPLSLHDALPIMYGDHRDLHSFPTRRSSDLGGRRT